MGVAVGIVLAIAVIDQVTKALVLHYLEPGVALPVIGDWFRFLLVFNPGAAFSFGTGATWVFTCIQLGFLILAAVVIPRTRDPWTVVALALIAGGALGNLVDRLCRAPAFFVGHVVDFISVGSFAIFNVADSAITCGVILFLVASLTEQRRHGDAAHAPTPSEEKDVEKEDRHDS
nr:signal peptidase II [Corynebacterium uropygiale]